LKRKTLKHSRNISLEKKLIFSIIAITIPIAFFVVLELFLRLFNYGPNLSLFNVETVNGKAYYKMNSSVKNRYFSRFDFDPTTSPEYFLVSKPFNTFRIFCLGGSTTVGYPYWYNGAFSSFLRDRLKAVFPDRSIEIVNLGMTATNSYTVVDLCQELIEYDPDLFIVYDGHNEFYGALGVASNESGISSKWMTRLYLSIIHLKTFQLVKNIISEIYSLFDDTPIDYSNRKTMMEQVARGKNIPYRSELYNQCFNIFQENLQELVDLCKSNQIPLFLSTQVSNLRDQFPFISDNSEELSQQQHSRFQQLYKDGMEFQSKKMIDSAIVYFRSAILLDSLYADIHYHLAQCLFIKGKKQGAYHHYILARDYDQLRFRTDSRFNNLIRSMEDQKNCFVADIEKSFQSVSKDSLIGNNLILEHLHPNSRGNFLLAKQYAQLMHHSGLLDSEWERYDKISDDSLWNSRHITEVDEFIAERRTEFLTSGWPFKNQLPGVTAINETDTLRYIADQVAHGRIESWKTVHLQASEYYLRRADFINAEKEFETIINQLPLDVDIYLKLARLCFEQKKFSKTEKVLLESLNVEQTSIAFRALGDIYMKQGNIEDAIHSYEEISRFPETAATAPENAYVLALAYLISEKPEKAIRILERTVNSYPAYRPAKELLLKIRQFEQTNPVR
jgi:tetratricopeptide (TPR) repeat protein